MSLSKFVITFSLIAFAAIGLAQAQTTCSPDQRKEFFLTAVDKDDTVIENLRAEHLSLKVGGSPATISDVVFQAKPALDLAILIDASVSQEKLLPRIKTVARAFVATVPVEGQDRVAVVSFSDLPSYIQPLTSELAGLGAAIDQVRFDAPVGYIGGGVVVSTRPPPHPDARPGSTSLWDTIGSVTQTLFDGKAQNRRRLVLLFTDGNDTTSSSKLDPVIRDVIKNDVAVFAIGVADSDFIDVREEPLKKLSEQTGGLAVFPRNMKEKLESGLRDVARHLRSRYVVGYCGGAAKDRAKLQLEVVDPEIRKAKPVLAYRRY